MTTPKKHTEGPWEVQGIGIWQTDENDGTPLPDSPSPAETLLHLLFHQRHGKCIVLAPSNEMVESILDAPEVWRDDPEADPEWPEEREATLHRIVSCVNALDGIEDPEGFMEAAVNLRDEVAVWAESDKVVARARDRFDALWTATEPRLPSESDSVKQLVEAAREVVDLYCIENSSGGVLNALREALSPWEEK